MKTCLLLFVSLSVACYGGPPTPILDAFISGAERLRSRVKNVGSFLEQLVQPNTGRLNFGNRGEMKQQGHLNQPPPNMDRDSEDQKTVIVIIENQDNGQQHNRPGPNRFPPHHHGPPPPFHNRRPGFPDRPGCNEQQYGCNGQYGQSNGPCNHIPDQNSHENPDKNNQPNESAPTTNSDNKPDKNYNDSKPDDKTKPTDEPLRVPLNPNEYIYSGDKIEINAPKRETNNADKNTKDEDEEFPIDLRFGNK